jgi:hypothetical protein
MSYPGLLYPKYNLLYLDELKERGYFILVDRNAQNISLLPGSEINTLLNENKNLFFVFNLNVAGTRQDVIDALYHPLLL